MKATKFDKIFTVDLTLTTYCQINGEDFVNFCGLLRKHELYKYQFLTICPQGHQEVAKEVKFQKFDYKAEDHNLTWAKEPDYNWLLLVIKVS